MTNTRSLQLIALPGIPLVREGDDLAELARKALHMADEVFVDGDVLVLAQKIVSKSEGRLVRLADVQVSQRAKALAVEVNKDERLVELILSESNDVVRFRRDVLIVEHRLGFVMANAGIDMSNVLQGEADDAALLLPRDPDSSCERLRIAIRERVGADIGVVINDSHGRAWRNGTVGVAIGAAGIPALLDLRGAPDLYGRHLQTTEVGLADEIAAAASLLMGQANEGCPMVLVRGLSKFSGKHGRASDLVRNKQIDLFR